MTATREGPAGGGQREAYPGNVAKIHLYQGFSNLTLFMPIWILFLQAGRHLSLTQVTTILGVAWLVSALAEVPTGAVADAFGRKVSLLLGTVLVIAGMALVAVVPGYWPILGAYLVWSFGLALQSGADMAMLYDTLHESGQAASYQRMAGRSFAIIQFAQGIASVVGAWLAGIALNLPLLATAGLTVVAVVFIVGLREPAPTKAAREPYRKTLAEATRLVGAQRDLRYLVLFMSLLGATAWVLVFVLFQPYLSGHQIPVAWFGVLFLALRLAGVLGSRSGPRLVTPNAAVAWLAGVPLAFAASFLVLAAVGVWWVGFVAMLVVGFLQGAVRPLLSDLLNQRLSSKVRATLLSLQSLVYTLLIAGLQPLLGAVSDRWGMGTAFALLAGACIAVLGLCWLWRRAEGERAAAIGDVAVE